MSKTPSNNSSSAPANKSAAASKPATGANPSAASAASNKTAAPATNGSNASNSSANLSSSTSTPAPASNWAKIAAGANARAAAPQANSNNASPSNGNNVPVNANASSAAAKGNPGAHTARQPSYSASASGTSTPNPAANAQQQHARKPSGVAEPFSAAAGKAAPAKPAGSGIAFGNVNESGSAPAAPSAQPATPSSGANPTTFGSLPATSSGSNASKPAEATPVPAAAPKTMPKLDFNSFFQAQPGHTSPTSTPTQEKSSTQMASTPSAQASNASLGASTSQQPASGASSRRASTYDNAQTAAMSPRTMAAQLPMQGTPLAGMQHHLAGGARPFSPMGSKMPQGGQAYPGYPPQSPGFAAGMPPAFVPGQQQQYAYSGGKPNGMPVNGVQQGGRGQQGGPQGQQGNQSPYLQNRGANAAQHHIQQQNRNLNPSSPRISAAGQPGQMTPQQSYYQNQGYPAQQQWSQYPPYGGYPQYPAGAYGQQPFPYSQQHQQQPGRPPMASHPSQMSTPGSPAPSMRPSLSTSGSGQWTPSASTNAASSETSGATSTAATPAPSMSGMTSPAPSASSTPAPQFRAPSTPAHGQHPSFSQSMHGMPSPSAPVFTPSHQAHTSSFSGQIASPSSTGSLNPAASTFGFQPRQPGTPTAAIPLARASKALLIKKPPPKEEKEKADKEKAEKAEKEKLEKESAAKAQAEKDAAEKKSVEEKTAAEDKTAADKKVAEEKTAADRKSAEEKATADAAAASEKAKKEQDEKDAKEKEELEQKEREKKIQEQEAEAKRIREQKEADEKAAQEKREADEKKKAEEEAAVSAAKAEAEKAKAQEEATAAAAAKEKEAAQPATPMSRQPSSTASTQEPSTPATPTGEAAAPAASKKSVPEPLDLSKKDGISEEVIVAPGSALSHARIIEDLTKVTYPQSINSPNPELNKSAKPGKFRYDRDFLMQFMDVCKEKPEQLPSLEAIGMTDEGPPASGGIPIPRSASHGGRNRGPGSVPGTPLGARPPPARAVSSGFAGGMGNFSGPPPANLTSEQRFAQATAAASSGFAAPGRPGSMQRAPSTTGGLGGIPMGGASGRGDRRSQRGARRGPDRAPISTIHPSDVAPIELGENRWTPSVQLSRASKDQPEDSPEVVERKVKALLNKLTIENFESISKQILTWANKSATETDGRILKQVIALIFEKATDEQTWSAVYAKLCLYLNSFVSTEVTDHSLKEANGQLVAGGRLFRRYLLTRCQADYERGWAQKETATAAAREKEADDKSKREKLEQEAEEAGVDKEAALKGADFSPEYYAAEKAKRRGLGLVRFIGELYKLEMLRDRIMLECIKKLIDNITNPEEEDIESLCRLLHTVGKQLEKSKESQEKDYMSIYFLRLQSIVDKKTVSSRLVFMILDLIDTRKNGWQSKQAAAGPKSLAEIHQDAERQKIEEARRTASQGRGLPPRGGMGRGGSQRGQGRDAAPGPDGWTQTAAPAIRPQKAGDLTTLGKIRSSSGSPAFNMLGRQNKPAAKEESTERPKNPFELLAAGEDAGAAELSPPATDAPQRRVLNLQPRTVSTPTAGSADADKEDDAAEEGEVQENAEEAGGMDEKTKRSIKNSVDEYLGVKMVDEGKATFSALPESHRGELVKAFLTKAVDGKKETVEAILNLFEAIAEDSIVSQAVFKEAFVPTVIDLEDIATDSPKAFDNVGNLMDAVNLTEQDVEYLQQQMVSNEDNLEEIQKRLMDAFKAASS